MSDDIKKADANVAGDEGKVKQAVPELRFMPKEDLIKLASYLFEQNKEIISLYLNVINAINKNMVQVVDNNDKP